MIHEVLPLNVMLTWTHAPYVTGTSSSRDDSLLEAVDMARASSKPALVLVASLKLHTLDEHDDESPEGGSSVGALAKVLGSTTNVATIGAAAVGVVSLIAIFMSRGGGRR